MKQGRVIFILLPALLAGGCGDTRDRAMKTVRRVEAETLRKDVAKFYKDVFAVQPKTVVTINSQYWSYGFKELRPERITAYPDGFAFCLEIDGDMESGLYILPTGMDHQPKQTPHASYEKLTDGIFWYSFKP